MKRLLTSLVLATAFFATSAFACSGASCYTVDSANLNVSNFVTVTATSSGFVYGNGSANTYAGSYAGASTSANFTGSLNPLGGGATLNTFTSTNSESWGGSQTTGTGVATYNAMGGSVASATGTSWGTLLARCNGVDASFNMSSTSNSGAFSGVIGSSSGGTTRRPDTSEGYGYVGTGAMNETSFEITRNEDGTIGDSKYVVTNGSAGGYSEYTGTGYASGYFNQSGSATAEYSDSYSEYNFERVDLDGDSKWGNNGRGNGDDDGTNPGTGNSNSGDNG